MYEVLAALIAFRIRNIQRCVRRENWCFSIATLFTFISLNHANERSPMIHNVATTNKCWGCGREKVYFQEGSTVGFSLSHCHRRCWLLFLVLFFWITKCMLRWIILRMLWVVYLFQGSKTCRLVYIVTLSAYCIQNYQTNTYVEKYRRKIWKKYWKKVRWKKTLVGMAIPRFSAYFFEKVLQKKYKKKVHW